MTDETIKPDADISNEQSEKTYTEFEQKMMNHGWNPDGQLSAEDWIDNGFKVKNKKLDSLFKSVETLKEKLVIQEKNAYAQAKADLESKRIAAIEEADVERVKQIEKQSQSLMDPSLMEYVNGFKDKHKAWLDGISYRDLEMQSVCTQKDNELAVRGLSPDKHFEALENYMRGKYPDYFGEELEPIKNAVEGNKHVAVKTSSKKKTTFDDLDEFQKRAALNLKKTKGISIEDYIKRLTQLDNRQ